MPTKKNPIYSVWQGMRFRCQNPKNHAYSYYGGRGIKVCKQWQSFPQFEKDMGPRPPGYTLDRINNDGHYEPSNCRWATRKEQQRNRRITKKIERDGMIYTIAELAERSGLKYDTVLARAESGMSLIEITDPIRRINTSGLALGGAANGRKNRLKTHCKFGHEFTPENTAPNGLNGRACKKCHAIRQLRRVHAKKFSKE